MKTVVSLAVTVVVLGVIVGGIMAVSGLTANGVMTAVRRVTGSEA